jgi:hypothetical protein
MAFLGWFVVQERDIWFAKIQQIVSNGLFRPFVHVHDPLSAVIHLFVRSPDPANVVVHLFVLVFLFERPLQGLFHHP